VPELTAEMIADLAQPQDLDLTPDGRSVVYTLVPYSMRDEHPTAALWVAPVEGTGAPRKFTAGQSEDKQPRWSPDGTQIAFLSDRATRGTAQLYVIAADGGEARALTSAANKRAVERFAWSPGGGHIAFVSADEPTPEDQRRERERDDGDVYGERWPFARLRLISLATGEVTTLVAGDRHVTDLAWSPDGTQIAYFTQPAPPLDHRARDMTIERVPVGGGEPHVLCSGQSYLNNLLWSADDETLLFTSGVSPHGQTSEAVYAVPAQGGPADSGQEPRRIALGEESCAAGLAQPRGTARAVVMVMAGLDSRLCWLDARTGALEPLSSATPEVTEAEIAGWVVRGVEGAETALAVVREAGQQPPEIWAGRAGESASRQITRHQSTALAGLSFGPQERFTWTTPDGWELDGLLVRPPDAHADGPLPMVVLVHGGPYGRWGPGFHLGWGDWAQWLALDGYAVLLPNPRGGAGHGERFAAAARGDVGGADFGDVMAAVDAAITRGIADGDRLGIGGWSQGGFMSAWAVTQTNRFKAAIMGAGVSDWGMMAMTSDVPQFERLLGGSVPWDGVGPHRHAQLSPISFARNVTTPVLILHGQKDERVPVTQAIGLHRALREAGVPCEMVTYPREPHGIRERAHQADLQRRVRAWYDRWLRG
jgi:dipeptidyl aminopeptidase/acylaminoacyl peptidase